MTLLSELKYGSYLDYSSHGTGEISRQSKNVCHTIKQNLGFSGQALPAIPYTVGRLAEIIKGSCLEDFFKPDVLLVPAPRSSLLVAGGLYPAQVICDCLSRTFSCATRQLLDRVHAVPKAATALKGKRPTTSAHFASMKVAEFLEHPKSILVVDDVITRGTMSLAAASLLADAFPKAEIRAFALVRTISGQEVTQIENPAIGLIHPFLGHAERRP